MPADRWCVKRKHRSICTGAINKNLFFQHETLHRWTTSTEHKNSPLPVPTFFTNKERMNDQRHRHKSMYHHMTAKIAFSVGGIGFEGSIHPSIHWWVTYGEYTCFVCLIFSGVRSSIKTWEAPADSSRTEYPERSRLQLYLWAEKESSELFLSIILFPRMKSIEIVVTQ
jgi:hypothetical protein